MITELLQKMNNLPFVEDIKSRGGQIYSVGGAVRDALMNRDSKDLDILVTKVSVKDLIDILRKYGTADVVGESFGIIKFKEKGSREDIDVSVPRTERKIGKGHQGFEIIADPFMPIHLDLERRDFSMNAIALDLEGNFTDPYNGRGDIEIRNIQMHNSDAFKEDPLRMLRAVQFAARFDFDMEEYTFRTIQNNAHLIKEISPERILMELEKIISKGDPGTGYFWLKNTKLFEYIFDMAAQAHPDHFKSVKTLAEFIFVLTNRDGKADTIFKNKLRGDLTTLKEIKALQMLENSRGNEDYMFMIFKAINISSKVLQTTIFDGYTNSLLRLFEQGKYPCYYRELAISGDELLALGYPQGKIIGQKLNEIMKLVLNNKLWNRKQTILNYLNNKKC